MFRGFRGHQRSAKASLTFEACVVCNSEMWRVVCATVPPKCPHITLIQYVNSTDRCDFQAEIEEIRSVSSRLQAYIGPLVRERRGDYPEKKNRI